MLKSGSREFNQLFHGPGRLKRLKVAVGKGNTTFKHPRYAYKVLEHTQHSMHRATRQAIKFLPLPSTSLLPEAKALEWTEQIPSIATQRWNVRPRKKLSMKLIDFNATVLVPSGRLNGRHSRCCERLCLAVELIFFLQLSFALSVLVQFSSACTNRLACQQAE